MKNRLAILFFLIISSCSSNFSFYEAEGFASISKRNLIITSLPKGTLLKITNHENKNSKIIKTDEKSNTLGSRIILLPMEIYKNLNLDKKYPLVYLESVRKNKSFVAKEAKTFKAERNVQNKIKLNKSKTKYFINKYYMPDIQNKFSKNLLSLATSSMDISDGLIADLNKLINKQNVSYKIYEKFIPVSRNLNNLINSKNLNKIDLVSNGDDYQILFTAKPNNARIINKLSKSLGVKISKIGTILSGKNKSLILDQKGREIANNVSGYVHQF